MLIRGEIVTCKVLAEVDDFLARAPVILKFCYWEFERSRVYIINPPLSIGSKLANFIEIVRMLDIHHIIDRKS